MDKEYYIITEDRGEQLNAGSKVYDDNRKIITDRGVKEIRLKVKSYSSYNFVVRKFLRFLECLENIRKICQITPKNSIVIVQHPFYIFSFIVLLKFWSTLVGKKLKFLLIIIDVESARFPDVCKFTKFEKRIILTASYIVSHNPKMSKYIETKFLYKGPISNIYVFDYLIDTVGLPKNTAILHTLSTKIAFAGNLSKSDFIYKLGALKDNITFNLYGKKIPDMKFPACCHYSGCYSPDKLPLELDASFGLVWDGDSIDTCTGNLGEYLRYNNPHKFSLYIASEMPVIVWKESAVAEFVEKHNIGFTVKSLHEIYDRIIKMNDFEYSQMVSNIKVLSKKIRHGEMLIQSVQEVLHSK